MARCSSCSAPLAANHNRCLYCGIRNDVDLHGKIGTGEQMQVSERICPHCDMALHSLLIDKQQHIQIEHCTHCFGLFFDSGELEDVLENSVSKVFSINRQFIENINKDRFQSTQKVRYIKCPQCQEYMRRMNYAHQSGVIVDRCKAHGVWLDSGELTHLLEWRKAGGQLLHEKLTAKAARSRKTQAAKMHKKSRLESSYSYGNDADMFESITRMLFRLFD